MSFKLSQKQQIQEDSYVFPYHYLDLAAPEYKLFVYTEYLSKLSKIVEIVEKLHIKTILDAGCGDGRLCYELEKSGISATGLDYSKQAIAFAKTFNPKSKFIICDLEHITIKQKFDAITLVDVLEHIKPKKTVNLISKISKLLKSKGYLIITVPTTKLKKQAKHYQHFTKETLSTNLTKDLDIVSMFGLVKQDNRYWWYTQLKRLTYHLYPYRNYFPIIYSLFTYIKEYFEWHIAIGLPEDCLTILCVCQKK